MLFAYGDGSEILLALYGPRRARPDQAFTVFVADAATGDPVAGAEVGGAVTGANGRVTLEAVGAATPRRPQGGQDRCHPLQPPARVRDRDAPAAARETRRRRSPASPGPVHGADLRARRRASCAAGRAPTRPACARCWSACAATARAGAPPTRRPSSGSCAAPADAGCTSVDPERGRWSYLLPARLGPGGTCSTSSPSTARATATRSRGAATGWCSGSDESALSPSSSPGSPSTAGPASAATVDLMVVGEERMLRAPKDVRLKERTVKVGGRRCRVGAADAAGGAGRGPAEAARARLRLAAGATRARRAACSSPRSAASARRGGAAGCTRSAAGRGPPAPPIPRARSAPAGSCARASACTWFWCELQASGAASARSRCGPSGAPRRPGEALRVTVRGYDD